jgi:hypothetical protein
MHFDLANKTFDNTEVLQFNVKNRIEMMIE